MSVVARITVSSDGYISGRAPSDVAPGEHQAVILGATVPVHRRSVREMRRHNLPWDGSVSLRREDMYDENGRLR